MELRRTLFEAVGKNNTILHGFMLYDACIRRTYYITHRHVFDLEQPRRKSESTSYSTQLNKTRPRKIDNWGGAHIHIFVFTDCKNNRFQRKLMMHNTNI